MALGDSYATVAELEARIGSADDGTFEGLLDSASRVVEKYTGRQFNKTITATARRFRPVDPLRLPVDDFHTTTDLAIDVDGTAWLVSYVDPRPVNGVVHGMQGWPYFDLIAVDRYWPHSRRAEVTVTAQWGWDAVPTAIKHATLDVAQVMADGPDGTQFISTETVRDYSVSFRSGDSFTPPPELERAKPYRLKRFGVA